MGSEASGRDSPLVSIVIPTYNRAGLLGECIDSALAQSYANCEVVVVDDGSTDRTPELCSAYGTRIRYFRKQNGGAASALNHGIRLMNGVWFKWLSSDDVLEPGAIGALLKAAESAKAGVSYGDFVTIDRSGRQFGRHASRGFRSQDDFVVELWYHFVGSAGAALISRRCFELVGLFDESIRYGEDYDWWLRAALIHRVSFVHVSAQVVRYRVHPGQISRSRAMEFPQLRQKIRANAAAKLAELGPDRSILLHYASMTRRYRRALAPAARTLDFFSKAPGHDLAQFWAGKLAPGWASRFYWASNPPGGT